MVILQTNRNLLFLFLFLKFKILTDYTLELFLFTELSDMTTDLLSYWNFKSDDFNVGAFQNLVMTSKKSAEVEFWPKCMLLKPDIPTLEGTLQRSERTQRARRIRTAASVALSPPRPHGPRTWCGRSLQGAGSTPRWPCAAATAPYPDPAEDSDTSRQIATQRGHPSPRPSPGPDLQQRQQQAVEPPPLQQAELRSGAAQLAEQHEQSHLVRGDPVADAEHVRVHDTVRQHRVEVQALVHARHDGAGPPVARETARARPVGQSPPPPPSRAPSRSQSEEGLCSATAGPPRREERERDVPGREGSAAPLNCPVLQPGRYRRQRWTARGWGQPGDGLRLGSCSPEELSAR